MSLRLAISQCASNGSGALHPSQRQRSTWIWLLLWSSCYIDFNAMSVLLIFYFYGLYAFAISTLISKAFCKICLQLLNFDRNKWHTEFSDTSRLFGITIEDYCIAMCHDEEIRSCAVWSVYKTWKQFLPHSNPIPKKVFISVPSQHLSIDFEQ